MKLGSLFDGIGGAWLEHVSRKMGTRYRSDTYRCMECDEILEVRQED